MFNSNNVSADFKPNTDSSKKAIGSGLLDLAGISIQYSVYPSSYRNSGIMVSLPSKAVYVDGKPVLNPKGYPVFDSLVTINSEEISSLIDDAIINAMSNKGYYLSTSVEQAEKAGNIINKVIEVPQSNGIKRRSFDNPPSNNTQVISQKTVTEDIQQSVSLPKSKKLPF